MGCNQRGVTLEIALDFNESAAVEEDALCLRAEHGKMMRRFHSRAPEPHSYDRGRIGRASLTSALAGPALACFMCLARARRAETSPVNRRLLVAKSFIGNP